MSTTDRIDWEWQDDGQRATADLGGGRTVSMRVVPDEYVIHWDHGYTDHELQNLEFSGIIVTTFQDGHEIDRDSLWGVTSFYWTPVQECRDYAEEFAADIISEAPTASEGVK